MAARWGWAFSASLSLKCFTRAMGSHGRCLSREAHVQIRGCYKNLPGAGVEDWTGGEVGGEPRVEGPRRS